MYIIPLLMANRFFCDRCDRELPYSCHSAHGGVFHENAVTEALNLLLVEVAMEEARVSVKPIVDAEIDTENRTRGLHLNDWHAEEPIIKKIADRYKNCSIYITEYPEFSVVEAVLRCAAEAGFMLQPAAKMSEPTTTNYMQVLPGGVCFAHGPYTEIQCPKWPACATDPQKEEYKNRPAAKMNAGTPPQEHESDCKCDCVNCVTRNHHQCYYNAAAPAAKEPKTIANVIGYLKSIIGMCADEESYEEITKHLWKAIELARSLSEPAAKEPGTPPQVKNTAQLFHTVLDECLLEELSMDKEERSQILEVLMRQIEVLLLETRAGGRTGYFLLLAEFVAQKEREAQRSEHQKYCLYCNQGYAGCDRGRELESAREQPTNG